MIYLRVGLLLAALGAITAAVAFVAEHISAARQDRRVAARRWHDLAHIDGEYFRRPDGTLAFVEARSIRSIYTDIRARRRLSYRRRRYDARARRWWWIARHLGRRGALRRAAERRFTSWQDSRLWASYTSGAR